MFHNPIEQSIRFCSPIKVSDGGGGYIKKYKTEFTILVSVRYLRGTEVIMSSRVQGKRPVIFKFIKSKKTARIGIDWIACFEKIDYNITEYPKPSVNRLYFELMAIGGDRVE